MIEDEEDNMLRSPNDGFNLSFAKNDPRVRSWHGRPRTNVNVPKDEFQDYDITYVVTDMEFKRMINGLLFWQTIMQKPEAMSLFPPELGNWFST